MDVSEYLPMFLAECREHLQELNLAVVDLEEHPGNPETVDAIFRGAHSLKGMAATMGFDGMARLTHKMEDVFEILRQRGTALSTAVTDTVLAVLDALSAAVDSIDSGEGENLDPAELIARLGTLVRAEDSGDKRGSRAADREEGPSAPVLAALGDGQTVLEISVHLDPEAPIPAVRALQLFGLLAENGELLRTEPSEDSLDSFDGHLIKLLLATDLEAAGVKELAETVNEVDHAVVSEYVSEPVATNGPLQAAPIAAAADEHGLAGTAATGVHHAKSQTVRVDAERLDQLMHLMGELVVQRTLVEALAGEAEVSGLDEAMQELKRSSHALQAMVMQIRMIPIEAVFMRFPRLVRDVATRLDKHVELKLVGKETELDRTVVDAIGDPLVHLIRNSLDHGLEPADERVSAGKSETGTLTISARHAGGNIVIMVKDDGRGIDPERIAAIAAERGLLTAEQAAALDMRAAIEMLFAPGFSTCEEIGDLSGRGVGMDAVRTKIRELGGEVTVTSVLGEGTEAEIRLPLTLAIMSALLVESGGRPFGIPLGRVQRTLRLEDHPVRSIAGQQMLVLADEALPLMSAAQVFGDAAGQDGDDTHVVIIRGAECSLALSVTKLVGQRELVTRPLPPSVAEGGAVSGAAVLSNGDIVLLADCDALAQQPKRRPALYVA